jgi:hypothetical protein
MMKAVAIGSRPIRGRLDVESDEFMRVLQSRSRDALETMSSVVSPNKRGGR